MTFGPRQLNQLYMAYLEHSIRYYELDQPIIDDALYDQICRALLRHWPAFQHSLKHLTTESDLAAGTGFTLAGRPELQRVRNMIYITRGRPLLEAYGRP